MIAALMSFIFGCVYAELVGYWLHRLLHAGWVPVLSRGHMEHHLRDYGPRMPMRGSEYYQSQRRPTALGIGMEWIVPIGILLFLAICVMAIFSVAWWNVMLFSAAGIGWGILMFNYMHDALHLENTPVLKSRVAGWFKGVRRLHDVHHTKLDAHGRMDVNFGICFFGMDKLFGTYCRSP